MESNGLPGRMFSGMGSGMLGLEMPLHPHHQNPQNPHHLSHPQIVANYAHHEPDHNHHPQPQQSAKQLYPYASKAKEQVTASDEDELSGSVADDGTVDGKRKVSPWQRMKWTDSMVRLLIMAVYYIGDEVGPEANDPSGKKKGGGGLLQKKGKWKSVSRAMMEKGFYVSPQQCEDKFNDLNKRYKRVNDILGKGTACRVVENQSLLETMDLAPKMKEEVRKLLNSKHLFFREMCAYHNSCGHAGAGGAPLQHSPETTTAEPSRVQQHCSENASIGRAETEASKMAKAGGSSEEDKDEDQDDESDEDDDDEGLRDQIGNGNGHDGDDENAKRCNNKRPRKGASSSPLLEQLSCEMASVLQDGARSTWEKKHWMKTRLVQLEQQQMKYQWQALELEKQRLKWVKFSSKKEREMEKAKLVNEKRRLENERMVLVIQQKELDLLEIHHQQQQQQQQLSSNR